MKDETINDNMENKDYLLIAGQNNEPEIFYTLEGEMPLMGRPSVFLRMSGCNLRCPAFKSPDSPYGCDSYVSWSKKNKRSFEEVLDIMNTQGFTERLKKGAILKLTGGEPLIHQATLINFVEWFETQIGFDLAIDFETNATIQPLEDWSQFGTTFTTSPKLASNGDPEDKRYKPEVLKWHIEYGSNFKFVVQSEGDIDEIDKKYVQALGMPKSAIWLMPCCGSRQEHLDKATQVAEWAKQFDVGFSPRMHLLLWNKALLV